MFAKSKHLDGYPATRDFLQWQPERLAVGGRHHQRRQTLLRALRDVREHVAVDIAVLVELGLGEDRESDVAQRIDPRPHHISAARGDVGEHRRLRFGRHFVLAGRHFGGASQQPTAERVYAGPSRRGGPPAEDGSQPHIQVWRIPDQKYATSRRRRGGRGVFGRHDRGAVFFFSEAHGRVPSERLSHKNSVTALPATRALPSYFVTGRTTEIAVSAWASSLVSLGSASPTSAICAA